MKAKKPKGDEDLDALLREKQSAFKESDKNQEEKINELDRRICKVLESRQKENIQRELQHFQNLKERKGNAAAIFHLKDELVGKKKEGDGPSSIIYLNTGIEVFDANEIIIISA